jgi:hypothetical protein
MARQTGSVVFEGTLDNLTGYKMYGRYYIRMKSSLDRKKILKDNRFLKTRRNAKCFGEAQKIATQLYHELLPTQRDRYKIWYPLRNKAQQMVRSEIPREEIIRQLRSEFITSHKRKSNRQSLLSPAMIKKQPAIAEQILDEIFLGRVINHGVELTIIDQLAASRRFVQNFLPAGKDCYKITAQLRSEKMLSQLQKFRR